MTTSSKDKTRKRMQWTGFVTLLSLFSLAISVDYMVRHGGSCLNAGVIAWAAVSLIIFAVFGIVSFVDNRAQLKGNKAARFKERFFMMIANSCTGNFVDITALIIFIIYIALIPNCIDNFTEDGSMVWRPFIYIGAVALSIFLKPTITIDNDDIPPEDRKVMFSPLSYVTYKKTAPTSMLSLTPSSNTGAFGKWRCSFPTKPSPVFSPCAANVTTTVPRPSSENTKNGWRPCPLPAGHPSRSLFSKH